MLAGQAMQSKKINFLELINNDVSCENKDHRHTKPYSNNFLLSYIPHRVAFMMALLSAATDSHGFELDFGCGPCWSCFCLKKQL